MDLNPRKSTADDLEQGPYPGEGHHELATPGKEFEHQHKLTDLPFEAVAPQRHPPHGEPGHPGSPWSLSKNYD